jgi:hypothetical protein
MVLILYLTLMYKTMGGESWTGFWLSRQESDAAPPAAADPVSPLTLSA